MEGLLAEFEALAASLPTGANVFTALAAKLHESAYPPKARGTTVQIWVIVGLHAVSVLLSVIGLFARWRRRNCWFFRNDELGFRPNLSTVTQVLFAAFSILYIIDAPLDLSPVRPSRAGATINIITYTPLLLALNMATWATVLAPSSTLAFATATSSWSERLGVGGRVGGRIAAGGCGVFILSIIPVIVVSGITNGRAYGAVDAVVTALSAIPADEAVIVALPPLIPPLSQMESQLTRLGWLEKITIGLYLGWSLCWLALYHPSAVHLLRILRARSQLLRRSIRRLSVVNQMVAESSASLATLTTHAHHGSPNSSLSTPQSQFEFESKGSDPLSSVFKPCPGRQAGVPTRTAPIAGGLESERGSAEKPLPGMVSFQVQRNGYSDINELKHTLDVTDRLRWTLALQLCIVSAIALPEAAFCISALIAGTKALTGDNWILWTGWSELIPSVFGSFVFTLLSFAPPRHHTRRHPTQPPPLQRRPSELDFAPSANLALDGRRGRENQLDRGFEMDSLELRRVEEGLPSGKVSQGWIPSQWVARRGGAEAFGDSSAVI